MDDQPTSKQLTGKQKLFVEYYLVHLNATKAAIEAGYSEKTAYSIGARLLKNVEIREAIDAALTERVMGKAEVLARLADHARGTIEDFVKVMPNGLAMLDLEKAQQANRLHLLKKFRVTDKGIEIELHDPQAALVHLGRYHKLFTDKQEISGENGGPIPIAVVRMDVDEL